MKATARLARRRLGEPVDDRRERRPLHESFGLVPRVTDARRAREVAGVRRLEIDLAHAVAGLGPVGRSALLAERPAARQARGTRARPARRGVAQWEQPAVQEARWATTRDRRPTRRRRSGRSRGRRRSRCRRLRRWSDPKRTPETLRRWRPCLVSSSRSRGAGAGSDAEQVLEGVERLGGGLAVDGVEASTCRAPPRARGRPPGARAGDTRPWTDRGRSAPGSHRRRCRPGPRAGHASLAKAQAGRSRPCPAP